MSCFVKCETCEAEISVEKCVFATHTKVIDGKEHVFCCLRCQQKFLEEQEKGKSKNR
jgi:YHS domain-containing protein